MANKLQADEISSIIKERIANFELDVNINETGKIVSLADNIAKVYGLTNVMAGEMVEFETGEKGLVFNLETDNVGVVVLGKGSDITEGSSVKRLGRLISVLKRKTNVIFNKFPNNSTFDMVVSWVESFRISYNYMRLLT